CRFRVLFVSSYTVAIDHHHSFSFDLFGDLRDLHSFPTRRSSDLIVRINALDSEWGREELETMARSGADALLLPKVESAEMVRQEIGRAQRLNSSHVKISYAVFCLKKKKRTG